MHPGTHFLRRVASGHHEAPRPASPHPRLPPAGEGATARLPAIGVFPAVTKGIRLPAICISPSPAGGGQGWGLDIGHLGGGLTLRQTNSP